MDGYALGRELRVLLGDASPTLIALTGNGQPRDQRRSEEAGFSMHLVKPIQAETLMDILAAPAPDGGRTTGRPTPDERSSAWAQLEDLMAPGGQVEVEALVREPVTVTDVSGVAE